MGSWRQKGFDSGAASEHDDDRMVDGRQSTELGAEHKGRSVTG